MNIEIITENNHKATNQMALQLGVIENSMQTLTIALNKKTVAGETQLSTHHTVVADLHGEARAHETLSTDDHQHGLNIMRNELDEQIKAAKNLLGALETTRAQIDMIG